MGGMPLLPPVLVAGMVSLFLTSRVSMIETQRDRQGELSRTAPEWTDGDTADNGSGNGNGGEHPRRM
jgi:hypothetical protein